MRSGPADSIAAPIPRGGTVEDVNTPGGVTDMQGRSDANRGVAVGKWVS